MQTQDIIYQHSPQFLPKIAIKLENMLASIHAGRNETHPIIHHYALKNIVDLIKIVDKPELKSRVTKEFLRLNYILPADFKTSQPNLFQKFEHVCQELQSHNSRFGSLLHQDPFLLSLRMRHQEQWSECELQTPFLFNWLHQKPETRQTMLQNWLKELKDLQEIVQTYTKVLHSLATFETIKISQGFYHRSIMANPSCQLVIMRLDSKLPVIPKFQVSPHALSIHFNDSINLEHPSHLNFDIQLGIVRI